MTNGSVSAHLDGLPHFKSFSETEQFKQASPLPHYRRVKAMQEKYGLEILTTIWPRLHTVKQIGLIKWIKICFRFLSFFNNHTPHSNRLTIEYNHCNRKLHRFSGLLAKTDKTLPEGQQANVLTPITQWHWAARKHDVKNSCLAICFGIVGYQSVISGLSDGYQ